MDIQLTKKAANKAKTGFPLIQKDDLVNVMIENQWVTFVNEKNQFVAKGYLGEQNKGCGWIVSLKEETLDRKYFVRLFQQAKVKRQNLYDNSQTNAFRIFNAEGDGLGGTTIDLYHDFAVFSWYNETIYQSKELLIDAFKEVYPEVKGIYEKNRFNKELPESQLIWGETAPEPLVIQENGVNYATYLNEGLMTGIFLDQKDVRKMLVSGFAKGKTVLNMFSYTGAFSVAAAVGGSLKTTSVDLAKRSLPKTIEQFALNNIDAEKQNIHVMDTFAYFQYAKKKALLFDLIILDPPSFARNKKKVFSVVKNYEELIEESLPILNDGGIILASTNTANLSARKFKQLIENVFIENEVHYREVKAFRLPSDFTVNPAFSEGNYLKVYGYQIQK